MTKNLYNKLDKKNKTKANVLNSIEYWGNYTFEGKELKEFTEIMKEAFEKLDNDFLQLSRNLEYINKT